MKLSISNIGWECKDDRKVYALMNKYDFWGLEIAPTRIFPDSPYDKLPEAEAWSRQLKKDYGLTVSSMQSIWYGRSEKLFGTEKEREFLLAYTKKAIDFAAAAGCKNLVFGCPANRAIPENGDLKIGLSFFREIGNYAADKGTAIGLEANPPIYHTNYINDTKAAFSLVKEVNSKGFLVNLDIGTMLKNGEAANELIDNVPYIHHVHISEPGLKPIEEHSLHQEVKDILARENYQGFVSIEMGKQAEISLIESKLQYIRRIFHDL